MTGTLTQDGFGNQVASTGSSANPYMYAATSGYRNDGDAGLSHVGARYYDAQVGRFISRDTFLDQKPYLYCAHDPINCLDPSGHELVDQILGKLPAGPGAVLLRGIFIFAPFYIAAVWAVHKYHKHWKYTNPPDSIGRASGGTRPDQAKMVEKYADPDNK